jgi:hypothetical protein
MVSIAPPRQRQVILISRGRRTARYSVNVFRGASGHYMAFADYENARAYAVALSRQRRWSIIPLEDEEAAR